MKKSTFDIFCGTSFEDAKWLESVEGLPEARERLETIAAARPGSYFIFSSASSSILVRLRIKTVSANVSTLSKTKAVGQ
jgi:hypothetical protein